MNELPAPPGSAGTSAEPVSTVDEHGARVQQMFSRIADGYDRANRWMSLGTDLRWRRSAVRGLLPADAASEPRIFDLCAGTLDSTLEIHRCHPHARIVAGDFSAPMLAAGRRKLVGAAADRIDTVELDAHDLPFAATSFDALFCAFGVRNLSDLERATREQARCLRPGGKLTVLEFFRPTAALTRAFHGVYNRTVLPFVGWAATGDLEAYLYLPRSIGRFETIDAYVHLLERCGFADVRAEHLTFKIAWVVRATRKENL